jgi:hypothetical protein
MSDESKTLKLLIELGVIGKEDVTAAHELLAEAGQDTADLTAAMPENLRAMDSYKEPLKNVDEGAGKAREALDEYIPVFAKARDGDDTYRAGRAQDNAVPEAQATAQKNVLKALELQKETAKMEDEKTKLTRPIGNEGQINDVKNQGDVNQIIAQGDVGQAGKGIAGIVAGGGTVQTDQRAFLVAFADDLAHRLGQLKPDRNFTSAQAAATAIESYFKNQPNPYGALLQQIYAAVQAAQSGHDATAVFWMQKFQELEAKIAATNNLHASG